MLQKASGQDCTAIPNSMGVKCSSGTCQVLSCERGYQVGKDGRACELVLAGEDGQKVLKKKKRVSRSNKNSLSKKASTNLKGVERSSAKFR
jgi:hypothetical protein